MRQVHISQRCALKLQYANAEGKARMSTTWQKLGMVVSRHRAGSQHKSEFSGRVLLGQLKVLLPAAVCQYNII